MLLAKWVRADDESIDVLNSRRVKGLSYQSSWIFSEVLLPRVTIWPATLRGDVTHPKATRTTQILLDLPSPSITYYELLPLLLGLRIQVELIRVIQNKDGIH